MKRINAFYGIMAAAMLLFFIAACDSAASRKKIGNSSDTSRGTRSGNLPIRDTATNNNSKQDSAAQSKKPNTAKGNADPSGHVKTY
jgi:hypothetical protein